LAFGQRGEAVFAHNQRTVTGEIDAGGTMLPWQIVVDGRGRASYDIEGATLTLSDLAAPELTVETSVEKQPAPLGVPSEEFEVFDPAGVEFSSRREAAEIGLPAVGAASLVLARSTARHNRVHRTRPGHSKPLGLPQEASRPHPRARRSAGRLRTGPVGRSAGRARGPQIKGPGAPGYFDS